jgi:tRNA A-37 threonylcarbamoyl transferase component Bud32
MSSEQDIFEETVAITRQLLAERSGVPVRLEGTADDLGGGNRSMLFRLRVLDGPADLPSHVIVKRVFPRSQPTDDEKMAEQLSPWFFNEMAGLQFLGQVAAGASLAPKLYAADRLTGILMMEDVGAGPHLEEILTGSDPAAAEQALLDLATTLGSMHALTVGKEAELDCLRDPLATEELEKLEVSTAEAIVQALYKTADTLDFPLSREIEDDLRAVSAFLTQPGPFRAYIHGDACPDNSLYATSHMKLIDFEGGRYGHALIDGVFADLYFPSCLCVNRIPDDIVARVRLTYRNELARGCPVAADDTLFSRTRVEACLYWILLFCHWLPLSHLLVRDYVKDKRDRSTGRQRILVRFERVARMTQEIGHLEALGSFVGQMAKKLRAAWPEQTDAMPYYPAFR